MTTKGLLFGAMIACQRIVQKRVCKVVISMNKRIRLIDERELKLRSEGSRKLR